ncbi:MAG: 23S rRNA (pseudouridine(1915)-N(3))-methyltransferase RlmH [Pseudomonadales bacterium]
MKIRLIAVGQRPPAWVQEGYSDYVRRLPRDLPMELTEIAAPGRRGGNVDQARAAEAERLLAAIGAGDWVVALDERGKTWSTLALAEKLENWRMHGRDVTFLIGGADGLAPRCLERADHVLSLSAMTLPHALVRVVLAEQIYRAWTITIGHPYHRA